MILKVKWNSGVVEYSSLPNHRVTFHPSKLGVPAHVYIESLNPNVACIVNTVSTSSLAEGGIEMIELIGEGGWLLHNEIP